MAAFIENLGIEEREKGYVTIVAKYTGCNPRKAKLFLNVLRIRLAIAERTGEELKPDLSAKIFVIEYVFPVFYKDVMDYMDQDLLRKLERIAKGNFDEESEGELENSKLLGNSELLKKHHKNEDLSRLLSDEPFFSEIKDIGKYIYRSGTKASQESDEPFFSEIKDIGEYIYRSGTKASQEIAASDESTQDELLSGDYMKLKRAADAINKMSDSDKQKFLDRNISKLEDRDARVRKNSAWALGEISDIRAFNALKKALENEDEDAFVRRNAAWALGKLGDPSAVEALVEAMRLRGDNYEGVRWDAAWALGKISDPRAVEALVEALKDKGKLVRRYASEALGKIGDSRAVEALVEALEDEDKDVRRYASEALVKIEAKQNQ